jgi:hypothetical protein
MLFPAGRASGTLAAGVPFQAPEHDAAVRVRERPVLGRRPRPREGLLAVEARRRCQPRRGALHGKRIDHTSDWYTYRPGGFLLGYAVDAYVTTTLRVRRRASSWRLSRTTCRSG